MQSDGIPMKGFKFNPLSSAVNIGRKALHGLRIMIWSGKFFITSKDLGL